MNEIIKVNYDKENPTVSGRELHERLGVATLYKDWFPRMCEYGFVDGIDFSPHIFERVQNEGGRDVKRTITDHNLTIPMAKEIAMLQRNEAGKQIRQQLIKLEEAWNTPEMVMARALKLSDSKIKLLESDNASLAAQIEADKPSVIFAKSVEITEDCILIRDMAKQLNQGGYETGEKRLYETLRNEGYLIRQAGSDYNHPTQKSMNLGLFRLKEMTINTPGGVKVRHIPYVTGKGQLYFTNRYLKTA